MLQGRLLHRVVAPGRINLIGDHTDYNGGLALPCAIDRALELECYEVFEKESLGTGNLSFYSADLNSGISVRKQDLDAAIRDAEQGKLKSWTKFALGALAQSREFDNAILRGPSSYLWVVRSKIPKGAGMSSSAALSCAFLHSLGFELDSVESSMALAKAAQNIEHEFAGTKCGLLDQLAICFGKQNSFSRIDFAALEEGDINNAVQPVKMHEGGFEHYRLLAINSGVAHSLGDSPYNERRATCEKAVSILNQQLSEHYRLLSSFSFTDDERVLDIGRDLGAAKTCKLYDSAKLKKHLETLFAKEARSKVLAKRVSHVLTENQRVKALQIGLETGDFGLVGRMLEDGHYSLANDYETSVPEIEALVGTVRQFASDAGREENLPVILGPRMTGGGFGGCVVLFCLKNKVKALKDYLSEGKSFRHGGESRLNPEVMELSISSGLRKNYGD